VGVEHADPGDTSYCHDYFGIVMLSGQTKNSEKQIGIGKVLNTEYLFVAAQPCEGVP